MIFQYCQSGFYASTQYLNINVHTGEYGYYITDGKAIPITWEKDGEFGVTHYYDHDHNEIVLNQERPGSASSLLKTLISLKLNKKRGDTRFK